MGQMSPLAADASRWCSGRHMLPHRRELRMSLFDFSAVIYVATHGINSSFYVPIITMSRLTVKQVALRALTTAE